MPIYRYRCADAHHCGTVVEYQQRMAESPCTRCPVCGADTLVRMICLPLAILLRGGARGRYVDGARRFRRPFVGRERDGSETVYETLQQAERGELERTENAALARKNVAHLRQSEGLLPGTRAAAQAAVIEERVAAAGDRFA